MKVQKQIIEYITKRGERLANEIDLIVCYGSYVTGNATALSDVDLFYIPRTDNHELSETFILNGVGYDIFPLSWDILQDIADFHNHLSPLLGDSIILFSHSDKERQRYEELKERMERNMNDEDLMKNRAIKRLKKAALYNSQIQQATDLSLARELAVKHLNTLTTCIAYQNQTYFHKGLKEQYQELQMFTRLPEDFLALYQEVPQAQNLSALQSATGKLFSTASAFCYQPTDFYIKPDSPKEMSAATPDYHQAATWYEEVCSSFNKIYACELSGNFILAFLTAGSLQSSLKEDLSISIATKELLSVFDWKNLAPLCQRAREIERDITISFITAGITLHRYKTIDELYQYHGLLMK